MIFNIFDSIEKDREIFLSIKQRTQHIDTTEASLLFNYHLYISIHAFWKGYGIYDNLEKTLLYFITKESNLSPSIASINNTYQMCNMLDKTTILQTLMGRESNFLNLSTDAAKVGAILALAYKEFGTEKIKIMDKTLFLS